MPPPRVRRALAWTALGLLVTATAAIAFGDPPYWDANVYVNQARFAAAHGLHLAPWRHPPDVVKPPVFTTLVLGTAGALTHAPWALHLCVLGFALALLFGQGALVRALGGSERAALLAGLLCATAPLFVAQAELVQSDLPMTALATWAWVALLRGRTAGWLALSALAVLTKESAYFLAAPAFLFVGLPGDRAAPAGDTRPLDTMRGTLARGLDLAAPAAAARRLFVAAWPGLVLLAWLAALHAVTGHALPKLNRDALRPNYVVDALIHQLVEGGRLPLLALALWALALPTSAAHARARLATALAVPALPLLFFAPLPRYMLPGLPALCALAALALDAWPRRGRAAAVAAALVVTQVLGWFGPSWHSDGGHHLDCNLRFRRLLAAQREAVRAVAAAHPRRVVAAFPLFFAFTDPPFEGWLPAPIPALVPDPATPTAALCGADFFVDADQSAPAGETRARLAGALVPWRRFGAPGLSVRVSRIACAAASPRTPPAPPPSRD